MHQHGDVQARETHDCRGLQGWRPEEDGGSAEGFALEHRKTVSPRNRARNLHVRPDLSATRMQEPTEYDWERLKRLFRYFKGCLRCVLCNLGLHEERTNAKLTTDFDQANEARTRKSQHLQVGRHLVQTATSLDPHVGSERSA